MDGGRLPRGAWSPEGCSQLCHWPCDDLSLSFPSYQVGMTAQAVTFQGCCWVLTGNYL